MLDAHFANASIPHMLHAHLAKASKPGSEAGKSRPVTKADLKIPKTKARKLHSTRSRPYSHVAQAGIFERDDRKKENIEAKAPTADKTLSSEDAQQQSLTTSEASGLNTDDQPVSVMPAVCGATKPGQSPGSSMEFEVEDAAEVNSKITEVIDSWNPNDFEGTWRIISDRLPSLLHHPRFPTAGESTSMNSEDEDAGKGPCKTIDATARGDSWKSKDFEAFWKLIGEALATEKLLRPAGSWRAGTPATWKELFNASRECMPLLESYVTFRKSTDPARSFEAENQELTALTNVVANVCRFLRLHRSNVPALDLVPQDRQLGADQREEASGADQIQQLQTEFNRMRPQWDKLSNANQQKDEVAKTRDERC